MQRRVRRRIRLDQQAIDTAVRGLAVKAIAKRGNGRAATVPVSAGAAQRGSPFARHRAVRDDSQLLYGRRAGRGEGIALGTSLIKADGKKQRLADTSETVSREAMAAQL